MNLPRFQVNAIWQRRGLATVGLLGTVGVGTIGLAPSAGATPVASQTMAGYQVTPTGGLASASATLTIPNISCTPGTPSDLSIGLSANGAGSAGFGDSCNPGGTTGLQFSVKAGSSGEQGDTTLVPKPGDVVVLSVFQSSTTTEAELHDLTQHGYIYSISAGNAGATTVFIGTTANPLHDLDSFTKAVVTNATINGDYLGFDSPTRYNYTGFGTTPIIKTSAITTNAAGSTFSLTNKSA